MMKNRNNYVTLDRVCTQNCKKDIREDYFVSYAVRGGMAVPDMGLRYGMPSYLPLVNSPVTEPSPMNSSYRWLNSLPVINTMNNL